MRNTTECRVQLGNLHYYSGNFALAADAFGSRRYLDKVDRKTRRRSRRRALLRSRQAGITQAMDLGTFDPVPLPIARVLDEAGRMADQPARVREVVRTALEEHGRHPWLLLELAWSKGRDGDRHASAAL